MSLLYIETLAPRIVFIDVGQGDSMLFVDKDMQILVDGGGDNMLVEKLHEYIPFYDRDIEVLVLTHSHLDHYGGFVRLLDEFNVRKVVMPVPSCNPDMFFKAFEERLLKEHVYYIQSDNISVGKLKIEFFGNRGMGCLATTENLNNSSVISLFKYEKYTILNMGDMEDDLELEISKNVSLLKAGHHCSDTSSSLSFLSSNMPQIAICSLGENNYGHPSHVVLDRFGELGIDYFITKDQGDILLNLHDGLIYNEVGKLLKKL